MPRMKRRVLFGIPAAALALLWLTTTARATTDDWIPAGHLDAWSGLHTATRLADGRVLVAGGAASGGGPTAGTWQTVEDLTYPRADHRAVRLADGRVLVCGGINDGAFFGPLSQTEVYSPTSGTWSPAASMAAGRYLHSATLLADGRVMV